MGSNWLDKILQDPGPCPFSSLFTHANVHKIKEVELSLSFNLSERERVRDSRRGERGKTKGALFSRTIAVPT